MNSLIQPMPGHRLDEKGLLKTRQLFVVEVAGRVRTEITELLARFALNGSFFLIVGGEWVPDQDSLRRSIRRYTPGVKETLENVVLARPSTCLQMRDQLAQAGSQNGPVLVLDFLHHFYDPDIDLSLRQRVLEECCRHLATLSRSKPVFLLVKHVPGDEYQRFFPLLASLAGETLHVEVETTRPEALQASLF